jgi:threonine aldolase
MEINNMIRFNSDYTEGCHPAILEVLAKTNMEQTPGYGEDDYCRQAAELIREECKAPEAAVHFLVGGTQTNVTVISSALKHYQGVITAESGHINIHETGALESCGHKCLTIKSKDGKLSAEQIADYVDAHFADESFEHTVQPKMVYISHPTELGTMYRREELSAIHKVCREKGLYLFLDGARLGYGLMSRESDMTLSDIAANTDVFYIGGTKVGALFGEAVVITDDKIKQDFRYSIKQHGGMLAKGRLLGLQFLTLFQENRYLEISAHAARLAEKIKDELTKYGVCFYVDSPTNQQFPILSDTVIEALQEKYAFAYQARVDESHSAIRICTSWATKEENVEQLLADICRLLL